MLSCKGRFKTSGPRMMVVRRESETHTLMSWAITVFNDGDKNNDIYSSYIYIWWVLTSHSMSFPSRKDCEELSIAVERTRSKFYCDLWRWYIASLVFLIWIRATLVLYKSLACPFFLYVFFFKCLSFSWECRHHHRHTHKNTGT